MGDLRKGRGVRLSLVLLIASLAGVVAGGWLVGRWAAGLGVVFDSLAVGAWALLRETGADNAVPGVHEVPTLAQVLERARAS
jgi:hypothetical protein